MDVPSQLLRAARHALGLSREDLAQLAGISVRTLASLEADEPVKIETLRKVQRALESKGVSFSAGDGHQGPKIQMPLGWPGKQSKV
ncbi:helix-turn-helix domain-containing protein [Mesorhizobium sp. 1B3]|uniref:helix-turn-helix domain-containing protein n=1 Tax=Mesorhizobium sp. 1B3 TaxID=3243599 RepID=UPI003D95E286